MSRICEIHLARTTGFITAHSFPRSCLLPAMPRLLAKLLSCQPLPLFPTTQNLRRRILGVAVAVTGSLLGLYANLAPGSKPYMRVPAGYLLTSKCPEHSPTRETLNKHLNTPSTVLNPTMYLSNFRRSYMPPRNTMSHKNL